MKIIVAVSALTKAIEDAFKVNVHCVQYFPTQGCILFVTTQYQSDVTLHCEKQYKDHSETVLFNNIAFARLLDVLKKLPEQPIALTIEEDALILEHFVMYFK